MKVESLRFVALHKDDDVRSLAFRKMPEGVDAKWVLQQIEGYQLAKKKLPRWAVLFSEMLSQRNNLLIFPPRISLEQCSSETTARYKAELVLHLTLPSGGVGEGASFIDLTGGFGVDFSYMAAGLPKAIYLEPSEQLCDIARHNLPLLGIPNAQVVNSTCEDFLNLQSSIFNLQSSIIFLDPSRRSTSGRKVVTIEDCTPNLLEIQDRLRQIADTMIIKLSPMLDITDALRKLKGITEVHVVSVRNECKELLFVMRGKHCQSVAEQSERPTSIRCVNLETTESDFVASSAEEHCTSFMPVGDIREGLILYEPNASILKAGVQDAFASRHDLRKLHPNSNLYVGTKPIANVPARQFCIVGMTDFGKANLKAFLKAIPKANIVVRNFPSDVATLRRRLKLKDGGNDFLFATTLADNTHALLHCSRLDARGYAL